MCVRIDGPDQTRRLDHPVVHADFWLTPLHRLGQDVVQPGVAHQEARCVVEPGLRVEIETLQTDEPRVWNRLALLEE